MDQQGKRHRLRDYAGQTVVLYFYPEDDTPGCTDEACQFRDALPEFESGGAVVLGVSPDSADSHKAFAAKFGLPFTLLADTRRNAAGAPAICDAYGVWGEKNLYGHKSIGVKRARFGVLSPASHHPATAACLVEVSFMDVAQEEQRLAQDAYRQGIAEGLAAAIQAFTQSGAFGLEMSPADEAYEPEDGYELIVR